VTARRERRGLRGFQGWRPFTLVLGFLGAACGTEEPNEFRGRGLKPAALAPESQALVYEAAARGAFSLDDPSLSLLLDPRVLPRGSGYGPGHVMPESVGRALRARRVIRGLCVGPPEGVRTTLRCDAELPGYVVRFSDVFALGPDSVEAYIYAQTYDPLRSGATAALRFERVYQIARRGQSWAAVREGRVPSS
jgi:hypothetical protein